MKYSLANYPESMTLRFVINCLIFLYAASISAQNLEDPLITIDLEKVIQNKQEVYLSRFVDKLDYIPLDRTSESALSPIMYARNVQLTDDYIIVSNRISSGNYQSLVFDRLTGKFIRKIGNVGKGPEEYLTPLYIFYNRFDNKIYTRGDIATIKIYNLEGKFLETLRLPNALEPSLKSGYIRLNIDAFLNADTYIYFTNNETEVMKNQIAIFNKNGEIKCYPPHVTWPAKYSGEDYIHFIQHPIFLYWGEKLFVKTRTNDTIFNITIDGLYPRIVLNSGDKRFPSSIKRAPVLDYMNTFDVYSIYENNNYLFFEFIYDYDKNLIKAYHYLCIFDKRTREVMTSQNNTLPPVMEDDLNGFVSLSLVQLNNKNELIAVLQAKDIKKWRDENPDKATSLKGKLPWLNNISELDNPVIVIGKCKD